MTEKITNITEIPPNTTIKKAIPLVNENFRKIVERCGLQFTTKTVTLHPNDWIPNPKLDMIDDVDDTAEDAGKTKDNPAKIPVVRACISVMIDNPRIGGVKYTDVIVAPHIADTDACADQLKMITHAGTVFVDHTKMDLLTGDGAQCRFKLMFWSLTATPTIDLDFDIVLI